MTISQPASVAMAAARSLVIMPPVPKPVLLSSARVNSSSSTRSTVGIRRASGWRRGSLSYSPSMSDSSTSRSAPMAAATMADRLSFSPMVFSTPISSVATASFSLMMGSAPSSSRRDSVLRTLRLRCSLLMSSPVSSSWATVWLYSVNCLS